MKLTRRDFVKYCGISAATLGLSASDLVKLEEALANPNGPNVIWLQGSGCTGCSISFLNRISNTDPQTAADVLIDNINLTYHPNLMALAGDSAVSVIEQAYNTGGYILVVEGGVPTAFGGAACWAWTYNGEDVTFQQAVQDLGARASRIISVGTCAGWGGIPAAGPNPTQVQSVSQVTGKQTINIAGCPPHPDWIVWVIVQLLLGKSISLDSSGRPRALYASAVHSNCPRKGTSPATDYNQDGRCLKNLGCRGPATKADCPIRRWNNGVNWCVDANSPCRACTDPEFPFSPLLR